MPQRRALAVRDGHGDETFVPAARRLQIHKQSAAAVGHGFNLERLVHVPSIRPPRARIVKERARRVARHPIRQLGRLRRAQHERPFIPPIVLSRRRRVREFQQHSSRAFHDPSPARVALERRSNRLELQRALRLVHAVIHERPRPGRRALARARRRRADARSRSRRSARERRARERPERRARRAAVV